MAGRYAVLLDGGFVRKRLEARKRKLLGPNAPRPIALADVFPTAADILGYVKTLGASERLASLELFRIYFYDAPPLSGAERNPLSKAQYRFDTHPTHALNKRLQDSLAQSPDVAVRKGELVFRGWKVRGETFDDLGRESRALTESDLAPDVEQKGVDLRIGLDVASLAFKRIVDVVVVVTGDSDLVPAMKLARREGLRVYLDPMGGRVRPGLTEHADFVFRTMTGQPAAASPAS
jgi:uncharacterized LabA/DUF88 family protein